ncbi:Kelch-type beta propeller [Arabidopsis suecica]|uniref:Kelch-type beta propeller n=1 Tax=Arabidopsis suecica TaxID=45249 RepID=A0A8T2G9X2_ARASU|nr:Kelch-type beta propeller [Arabidopsis suecica]
MTTEEDMRSSSSESSAKSFLSLPYDVVFNCLSRVSRTHDPILSLVSKSFRSLLALPDLEAERFRILKTRPASIPHPNCSTVVSTGSEIYLLGGFVAKEKRSRRAYVLDCKSHQWRRLPKMRIARKEAAANVIDGKINVYGGCSSEYHNSVNWGEIYDPMTQTWEPFPEGALNKEGVIPCALIKDGIAFPDCGLLISGKVYDTTTMDTLDYNTPMDKLDLCPNVCMLKIDNQDFQASVSDGKLKLVRCRGAMAWHWTVGGLEELSCNYLLSVASPGGGRRVTVWWKTYTKECKTEIWCALILLERELVWGVIEWSENVFTLPGSESDSDSNSFLLHYELVTLARH